MDPFSHHHPDAVPLRRAAFCFNTERFVLHPCGGFSGCFGKCFRMPSLGLFFLPAAPNIYILKQKRGLK